jgi:hypothetical protein
MKTINHKSGKKRSNLLLSTAIIAVMILTSITSYAQEVKTKTEFADVKDLFAKMEVKKADTSYTFKRNEDSARWELYNREIELYENKQKLVAIINQRYDNETGSWENYDRTIKTYNSNGDLIENLHQEWSPAANEWMNLKIKTISYNADNEKEEVLYHEWRQAAEKWISTVRYLVAYNRNGDKSNVLIKTYDPATDQWKKSTRYTFSYNGPYSKPSEALIEKWNAFSEDWEKSGKYLLKRNFRGKTINEVHVTWNNGLDQWINGLQFKRKYSKNLLMTEIQQRWDFSEKEWHNAVKNDFNYNNEGELTKLIEKTWSKDSSAWKVKDEYLYSQIKDIDLKKNK